MTVFVLPRNGDVTRLGIAATRKLGGAVQRNRAKRLVREIFRRHQHPPGLDIVVVPRTALLEAPWPVIQDRVCRLPRSPRPPPAPRAVSRRTPCGSRSASSAPTSCCCRHSLRAHAASRRPAPTTWRVRSATTVWPAAFASAPYDSCAATPLAATVSTRCPRRGADHSWKNAFSWRSSCRSWCSMGTRRSFRHRSPCERPPSRRRIRPRHPRRPRRLQLRSRAGPRHRLR